MTRQVEAAGATFEVDEYGSGAPVVLVHGALGDRRTWRRQCEALAPGHRALAYTQRWFGTGEWPAAGPRFGTRAHADDLAALVEALGLGPVHLVGWSYGGHVALTVAVERPDLVRSVFAHEPGFPTFVTDPAERAAFDADAAALYGPIAAALEAGDPVLAARRLIDGVAGREGYYDAQSVERRTIETDNARTLALLFAQTEPTRVTCAALGALAVPAAIGCGGRTRPAFGVVARAAARCVGEGSLVEVPRAGHLWPEDDSRAFAALVGGFVDAVDAGG